ncbi:hypothetical protein Pth03_75490 [Planotetraspora thailandica]|uniref:Uncharacterized protein n=1 Tax=Planotetraspora thailandica TaxID=487172 RepID=A0A8J4DF80_9ACTN|nr:hypothetical protein [Planotetraspora thailandica]GII59160.1 hypothetical protein Pth03_75490 [Planotetraspora thailandica]
MALRSARRWPCAAAAWTFAYGVANVWWLADPGSPFAPPDEPFSPGRWAAVTLAFSAAVVCSLIAGGIERRWPAPVRWTLVVAAWVAGVGLILYSYMLAISLAALLFDQYDDWASLLTRAAGMTGGALTLACAVAEQHRVRRACSGCGRVHGRSPEHRTDPTPRSAYLAAYVAVAGCAARVTAGVLDDVEAGRPLPLALDSPFTLFVVLLVLAGTLLPPALVHRWGRIWPRWVVPLAGRGVPRWLVLGPAFFIGASLTGYFGLAGMTAWILGKGNLAGAPVWRLSMEMFGYTLWGLGLLVAAASYYSLTRPDCLLPGLARP